MSEPNSTPAAPPPRRQYVRTVGPRLRVLLLISLALIAVLSANSVYLAAITFLEWLHRAERISYQNYFYQLMFLAHLVLGLALIVPFVAFGVVHMTRAWHRKNRRAIMAGYWLFGLSLAVLVTGVLLMRADVFGFKNLGIKDPNLRSLTYWAHVLTPVLAVWLYVLHRLAGPRIKWRVGIRWAVAAGLAVMAMVFLHSQHPRKSRIGSVEGKKYFEPSQARTASGNFIPPRTLMMDDYCLKCHEDAYQGWFHSAHHFSSFNNQPYMFAVKETRAVALQRDGNVKASRWCAGCHDVVPFFSGAFDDPNFDIEKDPTALAGITCTACHAITHVNSTIGNGDYTIDEPIHYPFAYHTNALLQYVNQQLVKAKPEFHKRTFLKPFMRTAEFCSVCHKVSLPKELNHYKDFLRGQNHYDTFLLSGVSGVSARSFYYPEKAKANCADCHMPLKASEDFGANFFNPTNDTTRYIHDHLFPAANTGVAHLRNQPDIVRAHQEFLKDCARVDIFGVKEGGTVDSPLVAPLRPAVPALRPGRRYLLEAVLRTLTLGHPLTQGTTDSNELWAEVKITDSQGRVLGRSGGLGPHREVDAWSHFVNTYMLDRHGNRIDRRNPQDIFTPLYNHQIPPGAAAVVHYGFTVPEGQTAPLTVEVKLNYRKFDTIYLNYVFGQGYTNGQFFQVTNDLPITVIASDTVTFPINGAAQSEISNLKSQIPEWQRWNDYGIGLLLEGDKGSEKGELIQAAQAFEQVEKLGRADGPVNLARVFFKEGRLEDAVAALQRANDTNRFNPPGNRWTIAWLNGLVNKQNGFLDQAITEFRSVLEDRYPELDRRGFDFGRDYEIINELGQTLVERAKLDRRDPARQREFLLQARDHFGKTLSVDSENVTAHYNLGLIHGQLGNEAKAAEHRRLHERYRPDDNARDHAIAAARRRDPAANHAAQATVIYDLQRPGAFGLEPAAHAGALAGLPE
jgi:tetratricopeptide (TPR) repeat protein